MKNAAVLALFGTMCFAADARKPPCRAANQGQFWPAEANLDHAVARNLFQRGELEMCSLVVWKYRWEPMSVHVPSAAGAKHPAASKAAALEVHPPRNRDGIR